jgi:hypothetical protein
MSYLFITENLHMNTSPRFAMRHFLLVLLASIALHGCATGTSVTAENKVPFDPQKRAVERSTARWKALTDKRFDEAFSFLSDASKLGITAGEYGVAMQRIGYTSAIVESATCEEAICIVKSTITLPIFVRAVGARPQSIPVEERWIMNNGELWLIRR